jgi:hypothetical protein
MCGARVCDVLLLGAAPFALPNNPYTVPEVTEDHRWTLDPKAEFWLPHEQKEF